MSDPSPADDRPFRWQALLHRAADPVFVLDRRRRLLFVNRAWEALTGFAADAARGLVCRHSAPVGVDASPDDALAHALTPSPEVYQGQPSRARRRAVYRTPNASPRWWDIDFLPLRQEAGYLVLGRILPLAEDPASNPTIAQLPERLVDLRQRRMRLFTFDRLDSLHPKMLRLAEQAQVAATLEIPVLIVGESGTGKHTLARILHAQGSRRDHGFLGLDCRILPPGAVVEALQNPGKGTIYLSSPECLPIDVQQSLCDHRSATTRLILGCRDDPEEAVRAGRLLGRLFWQASVFRLDLLPLRERPEDLPRLVERLLAEWNAREGRTVRGPTGEARAALVAYPWPGNLRELREVLHDSADRASAEWIDLENLPSAVRLALQSERQPLTRSKPLDLERTLEAVEARLITLALRRAEGNRTRAAEILGIPRARLLRRIEAFGLGEASGEP